MNTPTPLRLAGIGCGDRTQIYLRLAARQPGLYSIVGAADPRPERVERVYESCGRPADFRRFPDWQALLAAERFADVVVIGTQDADHKAPCLAAMEKGYDVLLEKPVATRLEDVLEIEQRARQLKRRVLVCHVLRYTNFYRKIKEIVQSGWLGKIISLNATEGVNPWHQAHSFVRGHWAVTEKSSPMILAKSCHDLDILSWLFDQPCLELGSYGGLNYFNGANLPQGAPERCVEGCPVGQSCAYNAALYATVHRNWLRHVMDGQENATEAEIHEWLRRSPWGRCVYRCGNTAVDHQVVAMRFEDGATATFTMTAFESGRHLEIFGSEGVLRAGEAVKSMTGSDIVLRKHAGGEVQSIKVEAPEGGHGGGDAGLVAALYHEMRTVSPESMTSSVAASLSSHVMGFAAEEARVSGRTVALSDFVAGLGRGAEK